VLEEGVGLQLAVKGAPFAVHEALSAISLGLFVVPTVPVCVVFVRRLAAPNRRDATTLATRGRTHRFVFGVALLFLVCFRYSAKTSNRRI